MIKDYEKPMHEQKGSSNNYNKTYDNLDAKKSVEEWFFYIRWVNRVSDFDTTSQFIINHAKKTCVRGNDVSEALRACVKPDMTKWEGNYHMLGPFFNFSLKVLSAFIKHKKLSTFVHLN